MFIINIDEKKVPVFIIESNSLKRKEFNIKNGNERENIEQILKILGKNHQDSLGLRYTIRSLYIDDEIHISIKMEKNSLTEVIEPLFIYSIVNSINSSKKVKFINLGKGKLFKFIDEDAFFELNKAFGEL